MESLKRAHAEAVERARAATAQWKAKVKEAVRCGKTTPPKPSDSSEPEELAPSPAVHHRRHD